MTERTISKNTNATFDYAGIHIVSPDVTVNGAVLAPQWPRTYRIDGAVNSYTATAEADLTIGSQNVQVNTFNSGTPSINVLSHFTISTAGVISFVTPGVYYIQARLIPTAALSTSGASYRATLKYQQSGGSYFVADEKRDTPNANAPSTDVIRLNMMAQAGASDAVKFTFQGSTNVSLTVEVQVIKMS